MFYQHCSGLRSGKITFYKPNFHLKESNSTGELLEVCPWNHGNLRVPNATPPQKNIWITNHYDALMVTLIKLYFLEDVALEG